MDQSVPSTDAEIKEAIAVAFRQLTIDVAIDFENAISLQKALGIPMMGLDPKDIMPVARQVLMDFSFDQIVLLFKAASVGLAEGMHRACFAEALAQAYLSSTKPGPGRDG